MGLIKAAVSSVSSTLAQQWKEYFYCDSIPADVICVRGYKKVSSGSSNNKEDNVISNGSVIAVADGQCMIIVDNGKVAEVCAEPGEFKYDSSTEPSIFDGGKLAANIKAVFSSIGKKFTFGGETPKEQRVYYFNLKEINGNKYGTPSPVPFRVVDTNIGLDYDGSCKCFGEYSFKVVNPVLFYTNVCGNVASSYNRSEIEGTMKTELLTALQPAFAKISEMGIRYSQVPAHTTDLCEALKTELSAKWGDQRGIELFSIGISSIKLSDEDEATIKELQKNAVFRNASMGAAQMVGATSKAMQDAANNAGGAALGFMGMNMASNQAAGTINQLYAQAASNMSQPVQQAQPQQAAAGAWFCPNCGTQCTGNFCMNCGTKKPEAKAVCKCSKCGYTPDDQTNLPKFCPNCGNPFNG